MVRRVMKRAALLGVLVVLASLYWRSLPVTLGALAGVALALVNFEVHRRLVSSMISQGRSGAAAGMFALKLGVLLGVLALDLDAWRVTRLVGSAGSGPREGEEPPRPEEPGGGIGI